MIQTHTVELKTSDENDILNLTETVQQVVDKSVTREGSVLLFLQSTTASLTIIEYEPGLVSDLPAAMERIAPKSLGYKHQEKWHDGNGHSHVKASIMGQNLTIPFSNGELLLGQWQQIVLIEFDVRPRRRTLVIQLLSD